MLAHVKVVGTMLPSVAMMPLRNRPSFGCETCGEDMEKKHLYLYLYDDTPPQLEHVEKLAVLKIKLEGKLAGQKGLRKDTEWQQDIPLITQSIPKNVETYVYEHARNDFAWDKDMNKVVIRTTERVEKIVKIIKYTLNIDGCDTVFAEMQDIDVMDALREEDFVKDNFLVITF